MNTIAVVGHEQHEQQDGDGQHQEAAPRHGHCRRQQQTVGNLWVEVVTGDLFHNIRLIEKAPCDTQDELPVLHRVVGGGEVAILHCAAKHVRHLEIEADTLHLDGNARVEVKVMAHFHILLRVETVEHRAVAVGVIVRVVGQGNPELDFCLVLENIQPVESIHLSSENRHLHRLVVGVLQIDVDFGSETFHG